MLQSTRLLLLIADPKPSDTAAANHNNFIRACAGDAPAEVIAKCGPAIIEMVDGLNRFATAFKTLPWNEDMDPMGKDSYAAPYILDLFRGLTGLLAMDSRSAMSCGAVHAALTEIMLSNGFTEADIA